MGEPLRRSLQPSAFACSSRRAIRSITFAPFGRYGGSAAIPLAFAPSARLFLSNKILYYYTIDYIIMLIQSFSVKGFLGKKDVHITFNDLLKLENGEEKQVKILVGENGIGKTQLLNMFYYTLTQDFFKLAEFEFDSLEVKFTDSSLKFKKSEIKAMVDDVFPKDAHPIVIDFVQHIGISEFLALKKYSAHRIMSILEHQYGDFFNNKRYPIGYSIDRIRMALYHNKNINDKKNKGQSLISCPKEITDYLQEFDIMYFPTYRRVEEDLHKLDGLSSKFEKDVRFLDFEETPQLLKSKKLIQFGMEDVTLQLNKCQDIIDSMIKDGMADLMSNILTFALDDNQSANQDQIWDNVTERDIEIILARAGDSLRANEREALKKAVADKKLPNPVSGYLLQNLIEIYKKQKPFDDAIKYFKNVCNKYLIDKEVYYDESKIDIYLRFKDGANSRIELSKLSSGEKQIISIFAKLYLSLSDKPYLLLFDEPELSLSLEWQAQLLPDIMDSGKCGFLLAVTHSPFIFDNKLDKYAASLSTYMKPINRIN